MNIIAYLQDHGLGAVYIVLGFLFVLTLVVFFHELGHFLVARWCGVTVTTFSVGFGKELFGFTDRHGTRWKLSAVPLGGFVKFLGDENAASMPDHEAAIRLQGEELGRAFVGKSVGQRAAIVAAGPAANLLLAIVILSGIFGIYGRQVVTPRADSIVAGSAAELAGLKAGDLVTAIDGSPIASFNDMRRAISVSAGVALNVTVDRNGEKLSFRVVPDLKESRDILGNVIREGMIGISSRAGQAETVTQRFSPPEAVWEACKELWFVTARTGAYIGGIFAGRESPDQLGGPILIAQISGQVASQVPTLGMVPLLNLVAFLSVNIGLLNLLPIPLLDGGHLLFFAAEKLRGRPLSERAQDIGFRIGFTFVVILMVFTTWNDFQRIFTRAL